MVSTSKEYVKDLGEKCPVCGSYNLGVDGEIEYEGFQIWRNIECEDCHSKWTDDYQLIGYSNLIKGKKFIK